MLSLRKEGHFKRDCKKHKAKIRADKESQDDGKKSGNSDGKDSGGPRLQYMAYSARDTALASQKQWYFDSGASDHITGDRDAFDTFRNITPFSITLGDESKVLVTGKGSVVLSVQGRGRDQLL